MSFNPPARDYTTRRGELSAYGRATNSARTLRLLLIIFAVVGSAILVPAILWSSNTGIQVLLLLAVCVLVFGLFIIWSYNKSHFIDPDLAFRKWLQQVCDGELEAKIELPVSHRHFKELDFHTRNLTSSLRHLFADMETLVDSQTQRLENQNQVLELLFKLTSNVSGQLDLQSVMNTVCVQLSSWLNDSDAAAYMLEDDSLKLYAASGPNNKYFKNNRPASDLPDADNSGLANAAIDLKFEDSTDTGIDIAFSEMQTLKIPVHRDTEITGMVEIFAIDQNIPSTKGSRRIYRTVSEQLSLFILKDSALESAHNARLVRERTRLGADLHDSLAQTLFATRYQVKMLRESLNGTSEQDHALRIEEMISEANTEIRGLIGEYRQPLNEHRQAQTIKKLIDEFNNTSEIEVYFQLNDPDILFTAREDTVVKRIIGEALNNARKYSNASTIRVYIRTESSGARSILIEDDGNGFSTDKIDNDPNGLDGNHIGLSIMYDRALSIGAILTIESELDEGTRVFLKLPPLELSGGSQSGYD